MASKSLNNVVANKSWFTVLYAHLIETSTVILKKIKIKKIYRQTDRWTPDKSDKESSL